MVQLTDCIAPSFLGFHDALREDRYTHYWLPGGRGSTKSSCVPIEIILGIIDAFKCGEVCNAIALRKVKDTLSESVFENFKWAIGMLGLDHKFKCTSSPMRITFKPNEAKILFRGADDPLKIKSIKLKKGYFGFVWYEELTEFSGVEEVRSINQSLLRGEGDTKVIYTYNPPISINNWVNLEELVEQHNKYKLHTDYRSVDPRWLGKNFILEAELLRDNNLRAYQHEYLGLKVGTGGEIFGNLELREITETEIQIFDNLLYGLDFGFSIDPLHLLKAHYDTTRRILYIMDEYTGVGISTKRLAKKMLEWNNKSPVMADSAEPRTISSLQDEGCYIWGARKGPDSIEHGIKFLQDLFKIVICTKKCPVAAQQFSKYEYPKDRQGNFIPQYPDKDQHSIDGCRYMMEKYSIKRGIRKIKGAV